MEKQLLKYGLTMQDADNLHWRETIHQGKRAIRIPYFEPLDTTRPVIARNGELFFRLRFLSGDVWHPVFDQKYHQNPNTGVEAYFPPIVDWASVNDNPDIPVIITEGEAKAAKGCKEGFHVIGLGGVNSYGAVNDGYLICRTLREFNFKGRRVTIIYDSDVAAKEEVVRALNDLAAKLTTHCSALPYVCFLPQVGEGKTGLDDFLIAKGADALRELLATASPLGSIESLVGLNKQYAIIKDTASIWSFEGEKLMSRNNFVTVIESTKTAVRYVVGPGGKVQHEVVSAAEEWLKWPMRTELGRIVYEPGKDRIIEGNLNVWPGWGCEAKAGDHTLFLRLLDYMFGDYVEDKRWFLQWLAYPLQHPGTKMFTAAVLYSVEHGTGKSFLGQIIGKIYGRNFAEIRSTDLHKNFNEWAENKQFILGDEITSSDKRKESDELKRLITESELRVNKKYVEEYVIRDCINYLFTTNHPDAFFLEDKDRRFFIHEITQPPMPNSFYAELHEATHNGELSSAVHHYLLHEVDTSDFNPRAKARDTLSKSMMFEQSLGDLASWVRALLRDPDSKLRNHPGRDLFTVKELLMLYDPSGMTRATCNGMSREIARTGLRALLRGARVETPTGTDRIYAVRNNHRWERADMATILQNLGTLKQTGGKF